MTLELSKTQKPAHAAMMDALNSLPPLPQIEEDQNTLSTPPKIETVSMEELLCMSFDDARNASRNARVIVASSRCGKTGLLLYLQLLRDTDPNRDAPETLQKEMDQ